MCSDSDLPVRVAAANTLFSLIEDQEDGETLLFYSYFIKKDFELNNTSLSFQ